VGAWLALRAPAPAPGNDPGTTVQTPAGDGETPSKPIEMQVVDPGTPQIDIPKAIDDPSTDVAMLLEQADAYKEFGFKEFGRKLDFPEGENAIELYQRVLAAEPGNAHASRGLSEIAAYYLRQGRALCERTIWTQCKDIAGKGLKAEPENADLKALFAQAESKSLGG
jgi:hypothetical protein